MADAARRKVTDGKSSGRDAKGAWVPYQDKRGRGVFYYNKVRGEDGRQAGGGKLMMSWLTEWMLSAAGCWLVLRCLACLSGRCRPTTSRTAPTS